MLMTRRIYKKKLVIDISAINHEKLIDELSVNRPTAFNAIANQDLVRRLNLSDLKMT